MHLEDMYEIVFGSKICVVYSNSRNLREDWNLCCLVSDLVEIPESYIFVLLRGYLVLRHWPGKCLLDSVCVWPVCMWVCVWEWETCEAWGAEQHSYSLCKLSKGVKGSGIWRFGGGGRGAVFCFMLLVFYSSQLSFPAAVYLSGGRNGSSLRGFVIPMVCIQQYFAWC